MKFQGPKGTRDYFPPDMAWRRHLEDAWRAVSVRNGFEEVDGPIFELLDLYKVKSGEGIVSELFHFEDRGGRELAIRPEFTPTLARMVAERAATLTRPIKWFTIPNLCRAERPQRGRLREFLQWNVDLIGLEGAAADAEVIFTAVDLLATLGLRPNQVKVKISHRDVVRRILIRLGVPEDRVQSAFELLDRRDKIEPADFDKQAGALGLDATAIDRFGQVARIRLSGEKAWGEIAGQFAIPEKDLEDLAALHEQLVAFGVADWCEYDLGIVRGLAYYTGTVFEVHEATGAERAMAGGGRYDHLIESFGGPAMPAVGFGMGDVVLTLVLTDKGLIPAELGPPVDAFVVAIDDSARSRVASVAAALRRAGLHARFSYKSTGNLGKLLKDAEKVRARHVVILDAKTAQSDIATLKEMSSGNQSQCALDQLPASINKQP